MLIELGIVILLKEVQSWNAAAPILVIVLGIVIFVKPAPQNVDGSIVVTGEGIVNVAKLVQPTNAYKLIEVIIVSFGIVTLVKA